MVAGIASLLYVCGLLLDIPSPPPQDGTFLALFESREYRFTGREYHDKVFRYRLFVPATEAVDEKSPLIVWLHGHGEGGDDNMAHLRWLDRLIMPAPWTRERFPFHVFALQCIDGNRNWTTVDPKGDSMVDVAAAIVNFLVNTLPIDQDRIYLTGVSSGGTGCWDMGSRYPELFAAIMPFGSAGTSDSSLKRLTGIPIWAFHSTEDIKPPVVVIQRKVSELRHLGGIVELTEIATGDHDCWTAAFARYDVLDWLFSQRRGQQSWSSSAGLYVRKARLRHFVQDRPWWQIGLAIILSSVLATVAVSKIAKGRRLIRRRW